MVKDLRPWHERVDDADDDSLLVDTDEPSGRFNADEIEFESFMFDPGAGSTAVQSEPPVRVEASPGRPLSSFPALSSFPSQDREPAPVLLEASQSDGDEAGIPVAVSASADDVSELKTDFSPARGISPNAIAGHEVPMPDYLRTESHEASPATDESVQMQATPVIEPATPAHDEAVGPSSSNGNGPDALSDTDSAQTGTTSDAITMAVRALSDTGPMRAGRRPPRSTGPLANRPTGPLGLSDITSTSAEQPASIASDMAATTSPADRWSDSYLSQLEDFSAVLLATRTEKRPRPMDGQETLVVRPARSTGPVYAAATPEVAEPTSEQTVLHDIPRDSEGVDPHAEAVWADAGTDVAEPEMPTGMLQEEMVQPFGTEAAEAMDASADMEPASMEPASMEPASVEMAQAPAALDDEGSLDEGPAILEGQFSGKVMEFESFMFTEGVQPAGPPLPNIEEFMPAVISMESALEETEGIVPFDAMPVVAEVAAQAEDVTDDAPMEAATEPQQAVVETASATAPVSSLPFWLRETGDLQSAVNSGQVHIEDIEHVSAQLYEPQMAQMDIVEAEPHAVDLSPTLDQAPQMIELPIAVEDAFEDQFADLPPVVPFDFSELEQPEEEESFGFNTEELGGYIGGSHAAMAATTDLAALADLLGNGPASDTLADIPAPASLPANISEAATTSGTSKEDGAGRMRPNTEAYPRTPSWTSTATSQLTMDAAGGFTDIPDVTDMSDVLTAGSATGMIGQEAAASEAEVPDIDPFDFTELNLESEESPTGQLDVRLIPGTGILELDTDISGTLPGEAGMDSEWGDMGRAPSGVGSESEGLAAAMSGTDRVEIEAEPGIQVAHEMPKMSNWQTRSWLDLDDVKSESPVEMVEEPHIAGGVSQLEDVEEQDATLIRAEMPTGWLGDADVPVFHAQEQQEQPVIQSAAPGGDSESGLADVPPAFDVLEMLDMPDVVAMGDMTDAAPDALQTQQGQLTSQLPQIEDIDQADTGPLASSGMAYYEAGSIPPEMPTGWLGDADLPEVTPEVPVQAMPQEELPAPTTAAKSKRGKGAKAEKAGKVDKTSRTDMSEKAPESRTEPVSKARVARADWAEKRLLEMQDNDAAAFMDVSDTLETSEEGYTMAKQDDMEQPSSGGAPKRTNFAFPSKLLSSGPLPELDSFDELQEMVTRNPDDLSAHMALAAAYTQAGELDPALRVYRRLLKKRNLSTTMMQMIADELGEFERDAHGQPRFHQVLGDLYMKQGLYREAIEEYNKIG